MTYPTDGQVLRASHVVAKAQTLTVLRSMYGMPDNGLAYCAEGQGFYVATRKPGGNFSRASVARNPANNWQQVGVNEARFRPVSRVSGSGVSLYEPGLIVDAAHTNCLPIGPTSGVNYAPGGATGTRTTVVDSTFGNVYRIEKTGGSGRFGFYVTTAGLSGSSYVATLWVRPWRSVGQAVIYVDAVGLPSGLVTNSASVNLSTLPIGEWTMLKIRGHVGGRTLSGAFSCFGWITDTGAVVDFGPYFVASGNGYLVNAEAPGFASQVFSADAPELQAVTPIDPSRGAFVLRAMVPPHSPAISAVDGFPARVLLSTNGIRLAVESNQQLTLTTTGPGGTSTIAYPWTSVTTGMRTIAVQWDKYAGTLSMFVGGSLVASASGVTADKFPTTTGTLYLGHSGAGNESAQLMFSWVAHYPQAPGNSEMLAATSSNTPSPVAVNWWDFRDYKQPQPITAANGQIASNVTGVIWAPGPIANGSGLAKQLGWF